MWNLTLKKIIDCETINVSGFWKNIEIFWATGSKYRQNKTKEKSKDTDKEQRLFEVKKAQAWHRYLCREQCCSNQGPEVGSWQ